jgi:hypothetical protein
MILLLCLGIGLFVIFQTMTFPSVKGQGFGQGPGFYPQVLACLLILLGILIPLQDIRGGEHRSTRASTAGNETVKIGNGILIILVILACIASTYAFKYCGFVISGFLLTLLTVRLIRGGLTRDCWGRDLGFSVAIIALVYTIFQVVIGIQLPQSIYFG